VSAIIKDIALLQDMLLLLNLAWFLANLKMVLIKLIKAQVTTTLHWGDQLMSQIFQMSSKRVKFKTRSKAEASRHHNLIAKGQEKMWKEVSTFLKQRLHIEGMLLPLSMRFSSVGTLSCIILQTNKDLEGGTSIFQIDLAHCNS